MSEERITIDRVTCDRCGEVVENPSSTIRSRWGWLAFEGAGSEAYGFTITNRTWREERPDVCPRCLKEAEEWWGKGGKA